MAASLSLELPFMDRAHEQFTVLLQGVDEAGDAELPAAWQRVVDLAAESFAREDEWMQATRFSCRKDHTLQHRVVLEVMREGVVQAHEGQLLQVRQMARVACWSACELPSHWQRSPWIQVKPPVS